MSTPLTATTATTPVSTELAALVAKVDALSKLALDMTKLTIDINTAIPVAVTAQVALVTPPAPAFVHGHPRTPGQMEIAFPAGTGDQQSWYVVTVGREPGLYGSSAEADAQVTGIPGQFRQKKSNRLEALAFYRHRYLDGAVSKINPAPVIAPVVIVPGPALAAPITN
ncbi:hypothetical protein C8R44DRAFT_738784 [Mycena epipterygia]|nr:hypothetical protein C8R44DRAFT_738784 [Mycena epipterygia]